MKSPYVKVQDIQPGQQFDFYGSRYVRATADELPRHPARENPRPGIILVYMLGRGANAKRTPASFLPDTDVIPR